MSRADRPRAVRRPGRALSMFLSVAVVMAFVVIGNWPVSSRQGVDYRVRTLTLPLYLKAVDFLSRDAHYRRLTREITAGARTPLERAMAIFHWTAAHLRQQPETLPVVDDHIWYTIVRGYGTHDQVADVFATLASYAGLEARRYPLHLPDGSGQLCVAVVRLEGAWRLVDPFHGMMIRNRQGAMASIDDLRVDPSLVAEQAAGRMYKGRPYADYFTALSPVPARQVGRAPWQHPWQRVMIELRHVFGNAS